jgi:hypothetical protein
MDSSTKSTRYEYRVGIRKDTGIKRIVNRMGSEDLVGPKGYRDADSGVKREAWRVIIFFRRLCLNKMLVLRRPLIHLLLKRIGF